MKLGLVTYNMARDWDVPTLIANSTRSTRGTSRPDSTNRFAITNERSITPRLQKLGNRMPEPV